MIKNFKKVCFYYITLTLKENIDKKQRGYSVQSDDVR